MVMCVVRFQDGGQSCVLVSKTSDDYLRSLVQQ